MRPVWAGLIIYSTLLSSSGWATGSQCELLFKAKTPSINDRIAALVGSQGQASGEFVSGVVIRNPGLPEIIVDTRARDRFQGVQNHSKILTAAQSLSDTPENRRLMALVEVLAVNPTRRYDLIDTAAVNLMSAIHSRLARRIDAHRFIGGFAKDTLEIPGVGLLTITIHQFDEGLTRIFQIEGAGLRIVNMRSTGRTLNVADGRRVLNDDSLPKDIAIAPLGLAIKLYEDSSGIHVKSNGVDYTNEGVRTIGRGHSNDPWNNELLPVVEEVPYSEKGSREKYLAAVERKRPDLALTLSWRDVEGRAAAWLQDLSDAINRMPAVGRHITTLPAEKPVPMGFQTLVAWASPAVAMTLRKRLVSDMPLAPEDIVALKARSRLIPLMNKGTYDRIANDGFVYLELPQAKVDRRHFLASRLLSQSSSYSNDGKPVRITVRPKNGEEMYVVDLTSNDEVAIANSMIPASQYRDGMYLKPMVIVRRGIELSEIEIAD